VKVSVEKSETLENAFYVFTFFWHMTFQKNVQSRVFWILKIT